MADDAHLVKSICLRKFDSVSKDHILGTVDVVYTWKCGGPHILITICANEMKLCVYNAYVL